MCLAIRSLSIDVPASLRSQSLANRSKKQIDPSTVFDMLLRVVSPVATGLGGPPAAWSGS